MPQYDLSTATSGRVANQDVDLLMIANQIVWQAPSADGPYYVNDVAGVVPTAYSDGTPNIVIGHLIMFHNPGFVTGIRWNDMESGVGNWVLGLWITETATGHFPDNTNSTKLASKSVLPTAGGLRDTNLDTPVAVNTNQMYVVTRYSATGHYVHSPSFAGPHGAFTDADPVYIPDDNENVTTIIPGWSSADRSLFTQGSGDVIPLSSGGGGPYFGVSPIFYKTL